MCEQNTSAAEVYLDGKPLGTIGELELVKPEPVITAEQAEENTLAGACQALSRAWGQLTAEAGELAEDFCRWIRKVAAEVEAQHEMETALRWASVDNRQLYNRYRHTKKKRIRKKYAKRILEWYRTEVAVC